MVQIHSLFRHGFINEPKKKIEIENFIVFCSYVTDFEKQDLCIDLIANVFRRSMQNTQYFLLLFSIQLFLFLKKTETKTKGAYSCLPSKEGLNYSSLFKG